MSPELPLKDIHLPPPVDVWPLAPGWWLLLVLTPLFLFAVYQFIKRLTRPNAIKSARAALRTIQQDQHHSDLAKLQQLSALLRRVAISLDPKADCARLSGNDWLRYLDRHLTDQPFSRGVGRCLADAHWRPQAPNDIDWSALFNLCERWLKQQKI